MKLRYGSQPLRDRGKSVATLAGFGSVATLAGFGSVATSPGLVETAPRN
jgi:hypothetical protein